MPRKRFKQRSIGPLERPPEQRRFVASLQVTGCTATGMFQDNDFYIMLDSNASSNLFLTDSSYRMALPRQIYLKDRENWEVRLHHIVYLLSLLNIPGRCRHSHVLLQRSDDFKLLTLPEGKYQTSLDVIEGILQCLNTALSPS